MDEDYDPSQHSEVFNHYYQLSIPNKEDLERVFTDDELKQLCLKHRCRVDMWRWNVVNDYKRLFTEKGRFQKWSEKHGLRMLAKGVNTYKPGVLYDQKEIDETRKKEWRIQLKDNILALNYWQRLEKRNKDEQQQQLDDSQSDMDSQYDISQSMNSSELLTQPDMEVLAEVEVTTEEPLDINPRSNPDSLDDSSDSQDSVATVLNSEPKLQPQKVDVLQSEDVAPDIEHIYGVNTESLTLDSQSQDLQASSQECLPRTQSQDLIPASYDHFRNIIPLTSTQSQTTESEEIIVT